MYEENAKNRCGATEVKMTDIKNFLSFKKDIVLGRFFSVEKAPGFQGETVLFDRLKIRIAPHCGAMETERMAKSHPLFILLLKRKNFTARKSSENPFFPQPFSPALSGRKSLCAFCAPGSVSAA